MAHAAAKTDARQGMICERHINSMTCEVLCAHIGRSSGLDIRALSPSRVAPVAVPACKARRLKELSHHGSRTAWDSHPIPYRRITRREPIIDIGNI